MISRATFHDVRCTIGHKFSPKLHRGEHLLHGAYLAAVYVEGHGIYPILAGIGFIVIFVHLILAGWDD